MKIQNTLKYQPNTKIMKFGISLLLIVFFALQSCIYDFKPDTLSYENKLVVYGRVTNEDKPVEVILSRTADINSKKSLPEKEANVELMDGFGNSVTLVEVSEGTYSTIDNFQGVVGEEYKIMIQTQDNNHYESEYEVLTEPVEISNVDFEFKDIETADIDDPLRGCQFYVDLNAQNKSRKYFRYEMDETWKIVMPYVVSAYWDGTEFLPAHFEQICYKHDDLTEFYVINTTEFGANQIKKFPITFVSNESSKLRYVYSLNVKQYTMTEKTYFFWKSQYDNLGDNSIYYKQPYQVVGNIKNIDNPEETVLGIFEASSVSNKRIFVKYNQITGQDYTTCELRYPPSWSEDLYGYYAVQEIPMGPYMVVDEYCVNCRLSGGDPNKPDFWED